MLKDAHALSVRDTRVALGLAEDDRGLRAAEVAERRAKYGPNAVPAAKPPTLLAVIVHQLLSPLIYILFAAAAIALLLGDYVDAAFICFVVAMDAALGTYQEWRAEQGAAALQRLLQARARVRRDGYEMTVDAEALVPGDLVLLESGNRVPADLRLLQCKGLELDEAFLTGESIAVHKHTDAVDAAAGVGDRRNMAFAGSLVLSGRALGAVVAIGTATQVGAIAESVASESATKPPLVQRMDGMARHISIIVLVACVLLAAVSMGRGMPAMEVFYLAVALAVSAIPEGLPVAVTVALSIATNRMAKRRVIVRRLTAVEGLGSCTLIASDKTGTLTQNRQTVRHVALPGGLSLDVTGEGDKPVGGLRLADGSAPDAASREVALRLARAVVRCNEGVFEAAGDGWHQEGDAVDVALLVFGRTLGVLQDEVRREAEIVAELPFESERAYSAVFTRGATGADAAVKGALERVLPRCTRMLTPAGEVPIDAAAIEAQAQAMASAGERFLAVADGAVLLDAGAGPESALQGLCLLGLVGLIDPPRPETREAVGECRAAGVTVVMVTGDHPRTSFAIARELGIAEDESQVVTGPMLTEAANDAATLGALVARGRVFARVAPMQKVKIVEALQAAGHFVAVTGDGVNDAPALKRANIGVAMGSGTDVTKDTASLIVTDDNFASIEAGVEEGRFAYDNIRKVTALLIATGAAEVLLFVVTLLMGLPLPLMPVQLLWLNFVTDGIQDIALAFEGGEPDAMRRPPRPPSEGIFNRTMVQQVGLAGLTMGALASWYWWAELRLGVPEGQARSQLLLMFVLMQNVHAFNCRSETRSVFSVPLSRNWILVAGVLGALGLHLAAMYLPFTQRLLRMEPLPLEQYGTPVLLALSVLVVMEGYKVLRRRRQRLRAA